MVWRKKKQRQESVFPLSVDWSRQAAYLHPDDLAELQPELDLLAEQQQAIRDILFLYWGLTDFCGISGVDHLGSFEPWRWLQCEADYDGGVWRSFDDALLLRQGSAVALLSGLLKSFDHGGLDREFWNAALHDRQFDHLPEARRAVEAGLGGTSDEEAPEAIYPELDVAYDEYVVAFFEMLAREGRPAQGPASYESRPRSSFREPL